MMTATVEHVIPYAFRYAAMPLEKRKEILPDRNVNSLYPAKDWRDGFFTGNGKQQINLLGDPYQEVIAFGHEALYEPTWAKAPEPPDLSEVMPQVRKALLEGEFEKAASLVEKVQLEAGFGPFMSVTNMGAIIPMSSLHLHAAFHLAIQQPELENTRDYLRWLDMSTGCVTVQWENERGAFKRETIASYCGDVSAVRMSASVPGTLDTEISILLPKGDISGGRRAGLKTPGKCSHQFALSEELVTYELAYYPDYGHKGYCSVITLLRKGGTASAEGKTITIRGADSLVLLTKTVKFEDSFTFGCSADVVKELQSAPEFDKLVAYNKKHLGEKMDRSYIRLGKSEDRALSGEELLRRTHSAGDADPTLLEKLYDMGRFYQIVDTGDIPPMWGQHNINTNLQVCAGNNTGLFEEMDVYFRYYETKLDDFRINAKKLFGARGLLASIHCDYDSGLFYHFSKTYPHYCWTGCLGWVYNELWGYYLVSGDQEFLKNRIVPVLKEIALFYEDYACDRGPDGHVIFYPSFSPEDPTPFCYHMPSDAYATSINSVMDVMICHEVLDNLIYACRELGIEQDSIPHWEQQRADLPRYLADEEGGLKEWAWPSIGENFNHRHVSHHYGLWPGRQVTWEEQPELAQAIQISNRKRGHQDDSAHGIIHRLLSAIRLKDVEETMANLSYMLCHGFVTRALNTSHFPYTPVFPDLQGAMPAILLEMCVFSMPGTVEFLPAMPFSLTGSLHGIWLYTWAKLEEMSWDHAEMRAELQSDRDQELTLRCRKKGARFWVNGQEIPAEGDHIRYHFQKGEKVDLLIRYEEEKI